MTTQKALDIIEQITTDFRATKPERQMIDQAMLMVSESLNLLDKQDRRLPQLKE